MKAKTAVTGSAVALATVALALLFFRGASSDAVYPAERAVKSFSARVVSRVKGLWNGQEAKAENVRLRREAASLAVALEDASRLEAENARLRAVLGYQERSAGRWVAAEVLSRGGGAAAARRTVRVGRGSLAGVTVGAAVRTAVGLVGKVTSVSLKTAEVTLLTDPSCKVSCTVEGFGSVTGVTWGGSDEQLVLRRLDLKPGAEVPPRVRVLTSGLGGVFPAGIEVGTLLNVTDGPSGGEGEVLPAVDFTALEDVFIRSEK